MADSPREEILAELDLHDGVLGRLTMRSRESIVKAQEEARLLGHDHVGPEHLLLALSTIREAAAGIVLTVLGVDHETLRARVAEANGTNGPAPAGPIPFTTQVRTCLEYALQEAVHLNHNYIATEHILLGVIGDDQGLAVQILSSLGHEVSAIREELTRVLDVRLAERYEESALGRMRALNCSFCGKSGRQVERVITGPNVYICNECVALCVDILEGRGPTPPAPKPSLAKRVEALEARLRELEGRGEGDE